LGLVPPQIATGEKSNEITAVPKLLKTPCLDFKGTIRAVAPGAAVLLEESERREYSIIVARSDAFYL
jgi:predicted transposase YbfD/YdcC